MVKRIEHMTDNRKHVKFHVDNGSIIQVNLTAEEIMMAHKTLGSSPEAVLTVEQDGSRYLIPVRRIVTIEVVKQTNTPIPPPVAPDSAPAQTYISEMDSWPSMGVGEIEKLKARIAAQKKKRDD